MRSKWTPCLSRKASSSSPLHMLGLQPTLHECCGPLGSTLRRKLSRPDCSHFAGFVTISWKRSVNFLSWRIVEIKMLLELDRQRKVVLPAALRLLTARTMAGWNGMILRAVSICSLIMPRSCASRSDCATRSVHCTSSLRVFILRRRSGARTSKIHLSVSWSANDQSKSKTTRDN